MQYQAKLQYWQNQATRKINPGDWGIENRLSPKGLRLDSGKEFRELGTCGLIGVPSLYWLAPLRDVCRLIKLQSPSHSEYWIQIQYRIHCTPVSNVDTVLACCMRFCGILRVFVTSLLNVPKPEWITVISLSILGVRDLF